MTITDLIEKYTKPVTPRGRGALLSDVTRMLMAAIEDSRRTGEARVWRGAADDWSKNRAKLLKAAERCGVDDTDISIGVDGKDMAFQVLKPAGSATATAATRKR